MKLLKYCVHLSSIFLSFFIVSCKSTIKPEALYGKWKYVKVENPRSTPPDSVSSSELAIQAPYIRFANNNDVVIMWGGKVLSHGKFHTEA
ncbi:MAG: hypothetical protein JWP44_1764, partial [Mucilaginibacter sp.]|nr:hypothetical protein [Mucilaginibacter sp.]